jgi:hypothetical protein
MFFKPKSSAKSPVSPPEQFTPGSHNSPEQRRGFFSRTNESLIGVGLSVLAAAGPVVLPGVNSAEAAAKKKAKVTKLIPTTTIPKTIGTNPNELGLKPQKKNKYNTQR